MAVHEFKSWLEEFEAMSSQDVSLDFSGEERVEIEDGDTIYFREWNPSRGAYTGRSLRTVVDTQADNGNMEDGRRARKYRTTISEKTLART